MGRTIGTSEVAGFDELDDGWVLEGFRGDLAGFSWSEKEFFPAGEGNADGFAGFVGEVHGELSACSVAGHFEIPIANSETALESFKGCSFKF